MLFRIETCMAVAIEMWARGADVYIRALTAQYKAANDELERANRSSLIFHDFRDRASRR